jgi:hypothetical protein
MREPLEIIANLKHVTHWSQPNIKFDETMQLLNELESVLTPIIEEPVVEEPIIEEVIEEPVVEEVVVKAPKRNARKK